MRTPLATIAASVTAGILCAWASAATAQSPALPPAVSLPPAVATSTGGSDGPYLLAGDDVLMITVVNFPNLSIPQLVVPPDGKIGLPLLEPFSVLGKTTTEVQASLTAAYAKYLVRPSVSVAVLQRRHDSVLVYGYVTRPGTCDFKPNMHVLEAIAQAGGALPNGELSKVVVTRRDGVRLPLDLSHPEAKGGTSADVMLTINDTVYVPERRSEVTITGEVTQAGSYDYRDDMTVSDLLTKAAGYQPDADLKDATLTRDGATAPLDLDALFRHGDKKADIKLKAGDVVNVPLGNRVYVYGAVSKPGFYVIHPGDKVLDALSGAMGPNQNADIKNVRYVHVVTKDRADVTILNLESYFKKGLTTVNPELQPNDAIYLPDKKRGFRPEDIWIALSGIQFLSYGAQLATHP